MAGNMMGLPPSTATWRASPAAWRAGRVMTMRAPRSGLVAEALNLFYEIRGVPGLKKKPSTSELLDWL